MYEIIFLIMAVVGVIIVWSTLKISLTNLSQSDSLPVISFPDG